MTGQPRRQTGPVISNPGKLYHPGLKGSGEVGGGDLSTQQITMAVSTGHPVRQELAA